MGRVLGNLKLTIGRLESQAAGYKVVINRLKLVLKIRNAELCSLLRIKWCGFYFVSTVPSLCHLYTDSQSVCPSLPQRNARKALCYLTSPSQSACHTNLESKFPVPNKLTRIHNTDVLTEDYCEEKCLLGCDAVWSDYVTLKRTLFPVTKGFRETRIILGRVTFVTQYLTVIIDYGCRYMGG